MCRERTLVVVKPGNEHLIPCIKDILRVHGLQVAREERVWLTVEQVGELYSNKRAWTFYTELVAYLTSGYSYVWVVGGENAVAETLKLKGKTHSPFGIRGLYGKDFIHNVFHCSDTRVEVEREMRILLEEDHNGTLEDSSSG